jgi:hypothetical protein
MPWVEMIVEVSGGRADGSDWPLIGRGENSRLLTDQREADELVSRHMAFRCDPPSWADEAADGAQKALEPPVAPAAAPAPIQLSEISPGPDTAAETPAEDAPPKAPEPDVPVPGRERQAAARRTRAPAAPGT